jgi:hypothetical protein
MLNAHRQVALELMLGTPGFPLLRATRSAAAGDGEDQVPLPGANAGTQPPSILAEEGKRTMVMGADDVFGEKGEEEVYA